MTETRPVLVIKLGALGDFVQALGPFAAIKQHHAAQRRVLLTTGPYREIAEISDFFDEIYTAGRPDWWRFDQILSLRVWLRQLNPIRVYDLQTSGRSSRYFKLFADPKPEWSGIAPGCSHPHENPRRNDMHTIERQAEQLKMADIAPLPATDWPWLDIDVSQFKLPLKYVLLAPGGAPHRPDKRWTQYPALAQILAARGITPVLLGTTAERDVLREIANACPEAQNLSGRTSLVEIAGLARRAAGAVGNDTGPMHLIAATGCPSLVLYSAASDPALCGQRGQMVRILRKNDLAELSVEEVEAQLSLR